MGSICSTDTTSDTYSAPTTPVRTIKPFVMSWESYTREQAQGRPEITETNITSIASLEKLPEKSDDVIHDLEERQIPVIKEALQSSNPTYILMNFMKNGADEFKERTGRTMTYSEMRAAWG